MTHQRGEQLDETRRQLQDLRGRSASLEALQQAALGKEQGAVSQWLSGQHLQDAPRLAEELQVETGWERAAECVLGSHLEAVCVAGVDPLAEVLGSFEEGTLTLFETAQYFSQRIHPFHTYGLQVATEHTFGGAFPTRFYLQLFSQARRIL